AAEIDLLARAGAAGLLHPVLAAERLEGRRLGPDPLQRPESYGVEGQRRDVGRSMARQRAAIRHDEQVVFPPAAITRLRILLEVVRQHVQNLHPAAMAYGRFLGDA